MWGKFDTLVKQLKCFAVVLTAAAIHFKSSSDLGLEKRFASSVTIKLRDIARNRVYKLFAVKPDPLISFGLVSIQSGTYIKVSIRIV